MSETAEHCIVDQAKRKADSSIIYRLRWQGFGPKVAILTCCNILPSVTHALQEDTWEPEENVFSHVSCHSFDSFDPRFRCMYLSHHEVVVNCASGHERMEGEIEARGELEKPRSWLERAFFSVVSTCCICPCQQIRGQRNTKHFTACQNFICFVHSAIQP